MHANVQGPGTLSAQLGNLADSIEVHTENWVVWFFLLSLCYNFDWASEGVGTLVGVRVFGWRGRTLFGVWGPGSTCSFKALKLR